MNSGLALINYNGHSNNNYYNNCVIIGYRLIIAYRINYRILLIINKISG